MCVSFTLTLLESQSRPGDKPLNFQVVWPKNGTAVLKGLNRSFHPSSRTAGVRADSSILEEIQVMWSQSYATEIIPSHVCRKHCSGQCNALYDRHHIHNLWNRGTKRNNGRENKNKVDKSKEKKKKTKKMKAKSRRNNLSCPPPRGRGQRLEKNELEKREK